MASVVKEDKEGRMPSDLVLDLYLNLLVEIWEIASALIGEAILALLFLSAIQKIGEKHRFVLSLKVSEEGIELDKVKKEGRDLPPLEIYKGFQGLINELIHLFSALSEGVINKELFPKVFPRIKEAERIVSLR